jgi:GNAT superfamily N-acetyltransferase
MIHRKLRRFAQLLVRLEFRAILQGVSALLPSRLFYYHRVAILRLEERKQFRRFRGVVLRPATAEDLESLARHLGRPTIGFEVLKRRWTRGDTCVLAEAGGLPVSMQWASRQRYPMSDVDYVFDPGNKGVLLYDAYTVPEWRMKGIHVNVMQHLLEYLPPEEIERVYSAIDHGNDHSLRTHLRFGFRVCQYVTQVRLLGLNWHLMTRSRRPVSGQPIASSLPSEGLEFGHRAGSARGRHGHGN